MSRWSRADCIDALQEAADRLGHSPTQREYQELDMGPSWMAIERRFESWNATKEAAGLDAYNARVTRERCLEAIQRVADDLGHPPTVPEYVARARGDPTLPSVPSINIRFDGFVAAREAALGDVED